MNHGQLARAVPIGDHLVRDPATHRRLPPEGVVVVVDTFWIRRVRDGSVELQPETFSAPSAEQAPHDSEA